MGQPTVLQAASGNFRLYLRVRNEAAVPLTTSIDALILDSAGKVVGQASGTGNALLPGQVRTITLLSSDPATAYAQLDVRFTVTVAVDAWEAQHIVFGTTQWAREGSTVRVWGTVTNQGSRMYSLDLVGTLLDATGAVRGVATGPAIHLGPRSSTPFVLTILDEVPPFTTAEVAVNVIIPK